MKLGMKVCIIALCCIGVFTFFFVKGLTYGNQIGTESSIKPVEGFIINGVFYPY